jgi:hypothetical protein
MFRTPLLYPSPNYDEQFYKICNREEAVRETTGTTGQPDTGAVQRYRQCISSEEPIYMWKRFITVFYGNNREFLGQRSGSPAGIQILKVKLGKGIMGTRCAFSQTRKSPERV